MNFNFLGTSDFQQVFKPNPSTSTARFFSKEVIFCYLKYFAPLYSIFSDFSKAFDKVDHSILFQNLAEAGVPDFYVRLIAFWNRNQYVSVIFRNCKSD